MGAGQVGGAAAPRDPASAVRSVSDVQQLGLPLGWHGVPDGPWAWLSTVAGWLIPALMLMLGAPFWFDTRSRLVQLRTTGARPLPAAEDQTSALSIRALQAPGSSTSGANGELMRTIRAALT